MALLKTPRTHQSHSRVLLCLWSVRHCGLGGSIHILYWHPASSWDANTRFRGSDTLITIICSVELQYNDLVNDTLHKLKENVLELWTRLCLRLPKRVINIKGDNIWLNFSAGLCFSSLIFFWLKKTKIPSFFLFFVQSACFLLIKRKTCIRSS